MLVARGQGEGATDSRCLGTVSVFARRTRFGNCLCINVHLLTATERYTLNIGRSLALQWLNVTQGLRVRSLVSELRPPTCLVAKKPKPKTEAALSQIQ